MLNIELDKEYFHQESETECCRLWEESGIHRFDPDSDREIFSVDTPPPYVSAAHLHVGHAMSYAQAEFIVRYKRMCGYEVFYPMGFDDNGLPTERFVEQSHNVDKKSMSRHDFRKLCIEETQKGAAVYEKLWRSFGLSVDWTLRYSTIDDHCRKTAQMSFRDLFDKGLIYRSEDPVIWDTKFETSLAQADVETIARKGKMHDIAFTGATGESLVISTTRPELLPACVGLFHHPSDSRYQHLAGGKAKVPLFDHEVPILQSEEVDPEFGTGLMMVCTFGDGEDVRKWRDCNLETRLCITPNGRMNELAGRFENLPVEQARAEIVKQLKADGHLLKTVTCEQIVSVAERSGQPIEFIMAPQWFIRMLDKREEMLARSAELAWHPKNMKIRLDQWIEGLRYDWNISRQRFYGVPFPVWFCSACKHAVVGELESFPVDPLEDPCPVSKCPKCGSGEFTPEADVMDTWMTSSLTPLINANWAESPNRKGSMKLHPMSVRVQAFEIIRTWLFYTMFKSDQHFDSLPWRDVMISGWGLNEQGKKISKRDLAKFTDDAGYNRYDPSSVIEKFGADALRYWAAGSHLGHDLRFHERDVKAGRKLVIKLWNAARFMLMQMEGFDPTAARPAFADRTPEDRWLLIELNKCIEAVTRGFEIYEYAVSREALDRFFWITFCDNYLELIKDRFWRPDQYPDSARESGQATLYESLPRSWGSLHRSCRSSPNRCTKRFIARKKGPSRFTSRPGRSCGKMRRLKTRCLKCGSSWPCSRPSA